MSCACCGETEYFFLTIDHINGGGHRHRLTMPGGGLIFRLKRDNFPPGYRILCYNCNCVRGHYPKCPHEL